MASSFPTTGTVASPALLFDSVAGTSTDGPGGGITTTSTTTTTHVWVHPVVLMQILDHHTRRQEASGRVIGTLLGRRHETTTTNTTGTTAATTDEAAALSPASQHTTTVIEVTNAFAVPHAERGDEVAIGKDFNKTMLGLHLRCNRKETVVGWYASAASGVGQEDGGNAGGGALIADTSSLIHEFYAGETEEGDPVHLVVDTRLLQENLAIRAYKSSPIVIQGEHLGNLFHEVRLSMHCNEPETICLHRMIQNSQENAIQDKTLPNGDSNPSSGEKTATALAMVQDDTTSASSPQEALQVSMEHLHDLLSSTLDYVNDVVDGKAPADAEMGRLIAQAVNSVPRVRPAVFDRLFHDALQDLLMVTYLSNITRTQVTIAEKLNASLGVQS